MVARQIDERPHDFRGGRTPSSRYTASPRDFPEQLPPLDYPGHFLAKRVTNAGTFRLKHKLLFIANALKQLTKCYLSSRSTSLPIFPVAH